MLEPFFKSFFCHPYILLYCVLSSANECSVEVCCSDGRSYVVSLVLLAFEFVRSALQFAVSALQFAVLFLQFAVALAV